MPASDAISGVTGRGEMGSGLCLSQSVKTLHATNLLVGANAKQNSEPECIPR